MNHESIAKIHESYQKMVIDLMPMMTELEEQQRIYGIIQEDDYE